MSETLTVDTPNGAIEYTLRALTGVFRYDVLYTDEHVMSDAEAGRSSFVTSDSAQVADAKADAQAMSQVKDVPHVAKRVRSAGVGSNNAPWSYTVVPFYDPTVVDGATGFWRALRAAYERDDFEVAVDPNYQTGTLTIRVESAT